MASLFCGRRETLRSRFLAMGDHLFDVSVLTELISCGDPSQLNLAIDRKIASIFDLDDAMKVQTRNGRVSAIGNEFRHMMQSIPASFFAQRSL